MIKEVIGIAPAEPGFRRIRIEPRPIDLQWAKGSAASPLGVVKVDWKIENDSFIINFSVPTTSEGANVVLPFAKTYKMDGITLKPDYIENGKAVFLVKSGSHSIVSQN